MEQERRRGQDQGKDTYSLVHREKSNYVSEIQVKIECCVCVCVCGWSIYIFIILLICRCHHWPPLSVVCPQHIPRA